MAAVIQIGASAPTVQYALAYAALAWPVLPVHSVTQTIDTRGVAAIRCSCGDASCRSVGKHPRLPQGLTQASTSPDLIRQWWSAWPTANLAIRTGTTVWVLDIDAKSGGFESLAALEQQYGPLPATLTARTQGGGRHYFFVGGSDIPSSTARIAPGIDTRGVGGYVVVEPSTIRAGYAFDDWDPLDGSRPVLEAAPAWLRDKLLQRALPAPIAAVEVDPLEVAKVRSALAALPAADVDSYHDWIECGLALHASGWGGAAYELWDSWSRQSDKYDPKVQRAKWATFKDDKGIGNRELASIFDRAQKHGWVNPDSTAAKQAAEIVAQRQAAAAQATAAMRDIIVEQGSARLPANDEIELTVDGPAFKPFPVDVLNDAWRWVSGRHRDVHPALSQAGVLAILATAAGRRYQTHDQQPLLLSIGLVTETTSDSEYVGFAVEDALRAAGMGACLSTTRITSPAVLYQALQRQPVRCYIAPDFGDQLQFCRRQPSGLLEQVLTAYAQRLHAGRDLHLEWSELGLKQPVGTDSTVRILAPHMSILAAIAGSQAHTVFRRSEISRGLVNSMLFAHAAGDSGWIKARAAKIQPVPFQLLALLRAMRGYADETTQEPSGASLGDMAANAPELLVVAMAGDLASQEALLLERYEREGQDIKRLARGAVRNLSRIASLLAIAENYSAPVVHDRHLDWAAFTIGVMLDETVSRYGLLDGSDDKQGLASKLAEFVEGYGRHGVSDRDAKRRSGALRRLKTAAEQDDLIGRLLATGEIVRYRIAGSRSAGVLLHSRYVKPAADAAVTSVTQVSHAGCDTEIGVITGESGQNQ